MTTRKSLALLPDEEAVRVLVEDHLPFVEILARRVALTMPQRIEVDDLMQDGVLGLIDAARRFDPTRGIKFETFAQQRVRGAMIDKLRKESWPRGIRSFRRNLQKAQRELSSLHGTEPDWQQVAAHMGMSEARFNRWFVRLSMTEATSETCEGEDQPSLPPAFVPAEPPQPDRLMEEAQEMQKIRSAIDQLPHRERQIVIDYYYHDLAFKVIAGKLGVGESRVSQLHARAVAYLRRILSGEKLIFAQRDAETFTLAEQRQLTLRLLAFRRPAV